MTDELDLEAVRDRIVVRALDHVPFDGWSVESLRHAAEDEGFDATMAECAFPQGGVQAVERFSEYADNKMLADAEEAAAELAEMRLDTRIAWLIRRRLDPWSDHRESVRRAVALLAMPRNAALAAKLSWRTADAIWHGAKDGAADFSYYTKRATVCAIFASTVMYWLADQSEDSADSWGFVERRIADSLKLTTAKRHLSARFDRLGLSLSNLLGTRPSRRRFGIRG